MTEQVKAESLELTLSTFAHWAIDLLGDVPLAEAGTCEAKLWELGRNLGYQADFLKDEVAYVLGRFLPENIEDYARPEVRATYERTGRGPAPRMDKPQRERLVADVIEPYIAWKEEQGVMDWNDLAVAVTRDELGDPYDVVLVDEAQDFSANQVRAVVRQLAEQHSTAFILDAVQRIYPHAFTWREVGVDIAGSSFRLQDNHRNTRQIAAFARPLVDGLPLDDDGTLPDLDSCIREGPQPCVVRGLFSAQMDWLVDHLHTLPADESIAILHPKGGRYLDYVRTRLRQASIAFVEMQGRPEWPQGPEQVGLSTLHSAKGLEFDHVVLVGLNAELMPHGPDEDDAQLEKHRRLVAMGVTRARNTAALTYKPAEASQVVEFLDPETFEALDVT